MTIKELRLEKGLTPAAFAESIGVAAEFVESNWDNKILELINKTIDCGWNGMTLTETI